jgi:CHAT domain-containing protein
MFWIVCGNSLTYIGHAFHTEGTVSIAVIELAQQIKEKGQRSTAELPELLQKAEAMAHDSRQDPLTRALAHRAAGNAHQLLNQFQSALENYDAAAALLESLNEPVELGRTLHAKVGMLFSLSRFDELFECSARARQLFEQCSDRKRLARLDVNLAHAYHRRGQPQKALECSERAVSVLEEIQDHEGFVAASINSAVTLTAMHEFERAQQRYRAALETAARLKMSSWVLLSQYNLTNLQYLDGDTAAALQELRRIRLEYQNIKDEWMICHCWLDESEILLEVGDLEDSIASARTGRALAEKLGLNSEAAKSLLFEAVASVRLGRSDEAAKLLEEAAGRFATEGDQISTAVTKLQAALFRSQHGDMTALPDAIAARDLLRNAGLPHRLALADIVIGRIQRAAGNHECAIDSFRSALNSAEKSRSAWVQFHACYELGALLDRKKDAAAGTLLKRADGLLDSLWYRLGSDELKMTFLTDRENVYTHLVRSTLQESPVNAFEYSEKARSRVLQERLLKGSPQTSAGAIRSRLSGDECIVEYFISGDDLHIFVVRQDTLVSTHQRGLIPRLKSDWEDLERHFASCSVKWERLASVRHHLDKTARTHLCDLYTHLILPVEHELRRTVIFAPHGFLHGVPLHALFDGKGYLTERFEIGYTPSASLYCSPAESVQFEAPLFVGFSAGPESSSIQEVEEAASLVQSGTVLKNPSIDEFRDALRAPRRILHIAGHAGIDTVTGKISWIETGDGRLTNRDLTEMNIRAKTLVITGCQTARRIIQPGDEWLGLMRSFYMSGAGTIVSAFWDIRDEAARRFSSEFYKTFEEQNALFAARSASQAVRGWRTHPYFWAGFAVFVRKFQETNQ